MSTGTNMRYSDTAEHKVIQSLKIGGLGVSCYVAYQGWVTGELDTCVKALASAAVFGLCIMDSLRISHELIQQIGENQSFGSRVRLLSNARKSPTPVESPVRSPANLLNDAWFCLNGK